MSEWGFEPRSVDSCFLPSNYCLSTSCRVESMESTGFLDAWGWGGRTSVQGQIAERRAVNELVSNYCLYHPAGLNSGVTSPRKPSLTSSSHLNVHPHQLPLVGVTFPMDLFIAYELSTHWFLLDRKLVEGGAMSDCLYISSL